MVASTGTVDKLYAVMRRHLSCQQINAVIIDLATIPGNRSFRDTVERLQELHITHKRKIKAKAEET